MKEKRGHVVQIDFHYFKRGSKSFSRVEPPLMVTSLQRPLFLADSPYLDFCLNLSTTVTFFCPYKSQLKGTVADVTMRMR